MMMAIRIQRARSRSSHPKALKADTFSFFSRSSSCFSTSVRWVGVASASSAGEDISDMSSWREEVIVKAAGDVAAVEISIVEV